MTNGATPPTAQSPPSPRDRFRGCLLGGAVGDALGAPVEFLERAEIVQRFGAGGIADYAPAYGGIGRITDDTQMTLFTAEGLLRAYVRWCGKGIVAVPDMVARAYRRWLHTQGFAAEGGDDADDARSGWLVRHVELHQRRAPGNTCLHALRHTVLGAAASNGSKGCGGVMRMAPVGLMLWQAGRAPDYGQAFSLGTELAALTHGHPTGSLTAGVLAVLVLALVNGATLTQGLAEARTLLLRARHHEETLRAIELAESLAASGVEGAAAIARLGHGWIAEEALAIAIYSALVAPSLRDGIVLAVNHDGDSDSTGAIAGNLLGAMHGVQAIPAAWLDGLELRAVVAEIADDLLDHHDWPIAGPACDRAFEAAIWRKYPGS